MSANVTRRAMLAGGAMLAGAGLLRGGALLAAEEGKEPKARMKLGLVTYNLAHDWDVPTILEKCKRHKFEGVELRTTHAHKVEPTLNAEARREVRQRFADSGVILWGLGSVCEFHSPDPSAVQHNIQVCREFVKLAADVGAKGVKVRPNGLPKEVPVEKTLEQIGKALNECGKAAADAGVEIWLEVHGNGTAHPPYIRTILDTCAHPSVGACWNSNASDVKDGSIKEYFDLLAKDIKSCHITDILGKSYPYPELFSRFRRIGYDRFTLCEVTVPATTDRDAYMDKYRARWEELVRGA